MLEIISFVISVIGLAITITVEHKRFFLAANNFLSWRDKENNKQVAFAKTGIQKPTKGLLLKYFFSLIIASSIAGMLKTDMVGSFIIIGSATVFTIFLLTNKIAPMFGGREYSSEQQKRLTESLSLVLASFLSGYIWTFILIMTIVTAKENDVTLAISYLVGDKLTIFGAGFYSALISTLIFWGVKLLEYFMLLRKHSTRVNDGKHQD